MLGRLRERTLEHLLADMDQGGAPGAPRTEREAELLTAYWRGVKTGLLQCKRPCPHKESTALVSDER